MTHRQPVIGVLDAGTYYHHRTFHTETIMPYIDEVIYVREFDEEKFMQCDAFIVSCRTNPALLIPLKDSFARFLAAGKTLVAMGETGSEQWLDGVQWTTCQVNFWWWKETHPDSGLRVGAAAHSLFDYITLEDATWHQHGTFALPNGAVSVLDKVDGGSVLYEDCSSTPGRLIVTSLDPMYHHGSYFMPATTRFLHGFFLWLKATTTASFTS